MTETSDRPPPLSKGGVREDGEGSMPTEPRQDPGRGEIEGRGRGMPPTPDTGRRPPDEMGRRRGNDAERRLSEVPPGHWVRVVRVLFESPRERCAMEGVFKGTILRCTAFLPDSVLLTLPDGTDVRLPYEVADYVSIREVARDRSWSLAGGAA